MPVQGVSGRLATISLVSSLTPSIWVTAWTFSWFGVVLSALLVGGYLAALAVVRARGTAWPGWKVASWLILGVLPLLYVTCGPVGTYRTTFFFMFGAQIATLSAITPTGLALGDPVGLLRAAVGHDTWVNRALHSLVAKVLMFPMVGSVLSTVSIILIFYTGYAQAASLHRWVDVVVSLQVLIIGMLVVLPLITEDLLPRWAGPGVRTFLAIIDGLLDAVPGILVMTAFVILAPKFPGFTAQAAPLRGGMTHLLDQKYAGGALLAIAEVAGLPLMGATFVDWMREDAADASAVDARLDEQERRSHEAASTGSAQPAEDAPWWLNDPRMADRFRRPGDRQ